MVSLLLKDLHVQNLYEYTIHCKPVQLYRNVEHSNPTSPYIYTPHILNKSTTVSNQENSYERQLCGIFTPDYGTVRFDPGIRRQYVLNIG